MIRAFPLAFATAVAVLVAIPFLLAGGPLDPTLDAQVFKWDPALPVNFSIDQGPLGELTNEAGAQKVRDSFAKWEVVPTSTIRFLDRGFLPQDVTVSNYKDFLASLVIAERPNPVIFDTDGKIIDDRLGVGASDNVLGFAGIRQVNLATRQYLSGWAVLNGKQAFAASFDQVVIHEIGHLIGLDHTQANHALAQDRIPQNNQFVPLMYPIVVNGGPQQPLRDDIAWISWLYPESSFRPTTGTITGKVLRRSGTAFQGANVVAVQVDTSTPDLSESRPEVVSVVSDLLLQNTGDYEIPGLAPGNYVVFIEPIDREFTEGSGVGPFEGRFTNFVKDYWNGANESATDSDKPEEKTVIQVTAGQTVKDITLSSNEKVNDLDALSDDDEMLFEFPQGFTFPFFGKVYKEVVINSDGNMTFGGGDSRPGQARSEERFLKGFPRIAPLFTDLDPGEPGDDRKVTAATSTNEVTFTWDNVPEFTDQGSRPGNKFSVTLFSNGDIRFKFETVEVTPDDNLQALVGITPGNSVPGTKLDLSAQTSPIPFSTTPVYEVFEGTAFDLAGKEILFKADVSFQVSPVDLFFPFFQGDAQNFTGFAVTNFSNAAAQLQMESRGPNGTLLPFPENPHSETISSKKQIARLGHEFFKADPATIQNGWVRVNSNNSEVASFFQFGNGSLTKLDGSVAFKEQSKVLFFTRVHDGSGAFRLLKNARTTLSIANPNTDQPITLRLKLLQTTGVQTGLDVTRTLPAGGMLFESLSSIFNLQSPIFDGFVRVDVTAGPGAVGFELIEIDTVSTGAFAADTVIGLNASFGNTATVLNSAQLASGNFGGIPIFTNLKLVNTSGEPRSITLRAVREDGNEIAVFGPFTVNGGQTFQRDVNEVFGFGPNTGAPVAGSIIVQATGPGVIGDIVFGDPVRVEFAAAMPLQTQAFRQAVFSQVAITPTFFTGLAIFNSGSSSAQVTIEVFAADGTLLGSATVTVGGGQRFSKTLPELIASLAGKQVFGGFIIVRSTQPLIAQQLFGLLADGTIKLLSAVPPTVVQ